MTLFQRKLVELDTKLAGLGQEFDRWSADSEAGGPLRKHRSQIHRVTGILRLLLDRIAEGRAAVDDGPEVPESFYRFQEQVLEVYRLWDFFRSKFALRYHATYQVPLAVADDFVWACYGPVLLGVVGRTAPVEPPLVHLSGAFSLFAHLRGTRFEVEDPPGALNSRDFRRALRSLPVPVIGMPWHQIHHLPDFLLLAHEVGHCVEQDFGLGDDLDTLLDSCLAHVPAGRRHAWCAWGGELFADCFATLIAGPAYVAALGDFLASAPPTCAPAELTTHPPAALRIAFTTRVLDLMGFTARAEVLREDWTAPDPLDAFGADVPVIAEALSSKPYHHLDDKPLNQVVGFSSREQETAEAVAVAVLDDRRPRTKDVRSLVAGARIAFDRSPRALSEKQEILFAEAVKGISDQPRKSKGHGADDEAAAAALFDIIQRPPGVDR